MTPTPATLDRVLLQNADDLYRLALLLAPDTASAEAALVRAAPQIARAEPSDEGAMIAALLAALPPERPPRRRARAPEWAQGQPVLAVLAALPRAQRLALALTLLRAWEPQRAAPLFGGDPAQVQRAARDALLALDRETGRPGDRGAEGQSNALSPISNLQSPISSLQSPVSNLQSPISTSFDTAECQPTRAMLALTAAGGARDPALRGHLALCVACRAVEQAWQQVATSVEVALRGALRERPMPDALRERMQAAVAAPAPPRRLAAAAWLHWVVPLAVVALVAALLFPRQPANVAPSSSASAPPLPPKELVQRALHQLYAPPADAASAGAVWHGRWQMQWAFGDGTFATLNADAWRDPSASRHRVQIAHADGGGPYEFELADAGATTLYAVTPNYGRQLYPLIFQENHASARLTTSAEQQRALLQARLESGAWSSAASYLRQAQTAGDLRGWGRQRAADGTPLDVLGFRGTSPLALPSAAPADQPTIFLAISASDGTLREVSEVTGPAGGEQTRQTTWRFSGGEWLSAPELISAAFDVGQAWNGTGTFPALAQRLINPALPLIDPTLVQRPSNAVINREFWTWMPAAPPAGASSAALLSQVVSSEFGTVFYAGPGRRLAVQTYQPNNEFLPELERDDEQLRVNRYGARLHASAPQSYRAVINVTTPDGALNQLVLVQAQGYARTELIALLNALGRMTISTFQQQVPLFSDPEPRDAQTFNALLTALVAPTVPAGGARHTVERHFARQASVPGLPADPYHQPLFGGRPPETIIETWAGSMADGDAQVATLTRDERRSYERTYLGPRGSWTYDAVRDQTTSFNGEQIPTNALTALQNVVLEAFACPNIQRDGWARGVVLRVTEEPLQVGSCIRPYYRQTADEQRNNLFGLARADPYLNDLLTSAPNAPLTTAIFLDERGRAVRGEVLVGEVLVESWAMVADEVLPAAKLAPDVFAATAPRARFNDLYTNNGSTSAIHTVTISAARALISPLWTLPVTPQHTLDRVEAGKRNFRDRAPQDTIMSDAVDHGVAVRLRYTIGAAGSAQRVQLVEGSADEFGAWLRAKAWWTQSSAVSLTVGGRSVRGWRVTAQDGTAWTLFELDGTLLATDGDVGAGDWGLETGD